MLPIPSHPAPPVQRPKPSRLAAPLRVVSRPATRPVLARQSHCYTSAWTTTRRVSVSLAGLSLLLTACAGPVRESDRLKAASPHQPPFLAADFALPQVATASGWDPQAGATSAPHFAVATAHPLATRAAVRALQQGGTAADALVAASFALTVVRPQSTGIGGGGFAVVVPQGSKPAQVFDFRETAPAATQRQSYLDAAGHAVAERSRWGGLAVAVPGYVAGLWAIHRAYGRLPWRELVEPSAALAERGFEVDIQLSLSIGETLPHLDANARAVFAPQGPPLQPGQILRWPRLARTLHQLAQGGAAVFYHGAIADDLTESVQKAGGTLTAADLAQYVVRQGEPLQGQVGNLQAWTMPQPSAGGAQILAMAQWRGQLQAIKPFPTDLAAARHWLVELMRRSFVLRLAFTSDSQPPPIALDFAFPPAARARLLQGFDLERATPTEALPKLDGALHVSQLEKGENTSHVSIIDSSGLAIASTHTINLMLGSGVMGARSGILLNDEMDDFSMTTQDSNAFGLHGSPANLVEPGKRPVSSMSPIILTKAGQPVLVTGTPGGTHIPTTVMQILAWRLWGGLSLAQAVAQPRVHHQAFPDVVEVEPAAGPWVADLAKRGHQVTIGLRPWCDSQSVEVDRSSGPSRLTAVSDPRGIGGAFAQ